MSYLVLARKYRPKTFTELVGQSHVVQALTNALRSQRLHHAYLFTGTRGVGKTTVSRILAKSLNCETGITAEPCGVCSACTDIDSGRFVDYTELDAASNRGVDEVQQLLEQAAYKPVQGRFKVFMIDEVHMLSNTAFNAMLKTLEEPPEYLKFVLATTDPHKVPVTVLSRCLQFNLRPMAPETIVEHLTQVLVDEHVPADVQSLRLLARAARGSMRDALSLTDQAIAFGNGELAESSVRDMLGSVDRSHVFTLIEALAHGDGALVVNTCESLRHLGLSASSLLEEMGMVLQGMAVNQAVAQANAGDDPDPDVQRIADLSLLMPADETQLLYSICLHGRADLGLAPDEYAALTMVLLRLLAFKPVSAEAEKKTLKTALEPVTPAPAPSLPAPAPVASAPAAVQAVALPPSGSPLGAHWLATVQDMVKAQLIQAMTRELAMQSQLMAQTDGRWHLQVESVSLNSPSNRERLELALQSLGHAATLEVSVGPVQDSPAKRITEKTQQRMAQAQADILNHPIVQRLIKDYDAKIIPGTLRLLDH
jgi:DNA polymerase-3 subunit gamma/tau